MAKPETMKTEAVRTREEMTAEQWNADFKKRNRPAISGFELKLAYYGEHPGWVRRWVVDQANRIPSLLDAGWRFVRRAEVGMSDSVGRGNTDLGDCVSVATMGGEGPTRQVLMETTQEIFDALQEANLERVRKTESAIQGGAFAVDDAANTYQPKWAENRIQR